MRQENISEYREKGGLKVKKYENPSIEITELNTADVIRTSGTSTFPKDDTTKDDEL